jgi:hypothetical protein
LGPPGGGRFLPPPALAQPDQPAQEKRKEKTSKIVVLIAS